MSKKVQMRQTRMICGLLWESEDGKHWRTQAGPLRLAICPTDVGQFKPEIRLSGKAVAKCPEGSLESALFALYAPLQAIAASAQALSMLVLEAT